ncbi:MAG: HEAT repeat domain-containing protein, partial [Cyanobacteria bacterium]|nr:HEAT repeat domain-containing protein [Cyanobacteriota bacterium]MDW8202108.1 HEAT repeat domain-containing protein [Cyanobacteriota bacterium SKYGB_h_bin112]
GIKTIASYTAVKTLAEVGDPSYYVEAAALRAVGTIAATVTSQEKSAIALLKTALENRSGWNEIVRSGAIGGLSQLKTSVAALDLILDYTELGVPQPLRLAAIRALGAISPGQAAPDVTRILDRLQLLARETFFLTQVAVCSALGQMETTRAIGILQSLADQTPDGRVRRLAEEAIQSVQRQAGSDKAVKQLREELEELKQANQELRSRLAALEAKTASTPNQS